MGTERSGQMQKLCRIMGWDDGLRVNGRVKNDSQTPPWHEPLSKSIFSLREGTLEEIPGLGY